MQYIESTRNFMSRVSSSSILELLTLTSKMVGYSLTAPHQVPAMHVWGAIEGAWVALHPPPCPLEYATLHLAPSKGEWHAQSSKLGIRVLPDRKFGAPDTFHAIN